MTPADPDAASTHGVARSALTVATAIAAVTLAIWLQPASLHIVAWPRSGPHRIAVFAPLYRLLWLGAGASVVTAALLVFTARAGWLERLAFLCAPLNVLWAWTVPYWPWLPDRLPLLAALAGPLRWTFVAVALVGVASRLPRPVWHWEFPGRRTAFVLAFVVYVAFGLRARELVGLSGDEPHYLIITHSLLVDHDLRIENNHAAGDYRAFFADELRPDYLRRGTNGEIYSIHAPGLSALLLPGYALAGADGAIWTVCLLAALAALAIFDVVAMVATPLLAWLSWFAICLTVPFIPHAWALYPEIAGAAIAAWALRWSLETRATATPTWLWRGCCLAWLPWLHTKFIVFLAGLTALLVWQLRSRWREAVAFLLPISVSSVTWLMFFKVIYGSFDPQAPYGPYTAQFVRFENVPRSLLGLLFDPKFGVLVYAPIYGLMVPGLWAFARDSRWRLFTLASLGLAAAYALSSARLYMWWGGSSAPARFLVPIVPLLAPMIAAGIMSTRTVAGRATWMLLGAISVFIGIAGALGTGRLLYSEPHGFARMLEAIQGSAPLAAAIPTFTQEAWLAPALHLVPWVAAAILAIGAGALLARWVFDELWIALTVILVFTIVAASVGSAVPAEARVEARTRGALDLLDDFDPLRARAFDYAQMTRLSAQNWLGALRVTFNRDPGVEPDGVGRVTGPLRLPPGRYEARAWFDGERTRSGTFQAVENGYQLARVDGPLTNPAVLDVDLPNRSPVDVDAAHES